MEYLRLALDRFRYYYVDGILEANIIEDGGPLCASQIPTNYGYITMVFWTIVHIYLYKTLMKKVMASGANGLAPSVFEKMLGYFCLATYLLQSYYKILSRKGMFMFNPCHFNILILVYLLLAKTSEFNRKLAIMWETWLFGPLVALVFPHLNGLDNNFEIFLYYLEHLLILPVGPLVIQYRYGLTRPNFWNQMLGFCTVILYQYGVLSVLSRATLVNLNFTLCHSPADFGFDLFGYHYFTMGMFYLNIISFVWRNLMYPIRMLMFSIIKTKVS